MVLEGMFVKSSDLSLVEKSLLLCLIEGNSRLFRADTFEREFREESIARFCFLAINQWIILI